MALNSGSDVKFNGSVTVNGNAFLYQGAVMNLLGNVTFNGTVFHDLYSSVSSKNPVNSQLMGSTELALRDTIYQLASAAKSLASTQALDPANPQALDLTQGASFAADPGVKVNVISARDVALGSGASITFIGDASSVFVLKVSGVASFGSGISLIGALPKNVLVFLDSTDSQAAVSIGGNSGVSGTFLSLDRVIGFSGQGSFKGAIISGARTSPAISVGGSGGGTITEFQADAFCAQQ